MKNFDVRIRETLQTAVTVEAENMAQARDIVERNWKNSAYVLDASDFQSVVSEALYPQYRDYER